MNLNGVWRLGICTDEEYRKLKLEIWKPLRKRESWW